MMVGRIAYVVNTFPKLSESFIAGELAELRRRGIEVMILSLRPPGESLRHEVVEEAGLDTRTVYDRTGFVATLRRFGPDLLHAHFANEPTAAAAELATELRIPFTFTAHGHDIYRRAPDDFGARAARASAVVTVSQANAAYLAGHFGVPASKVRVISCGVDTARFRPNGAAAAPPWILCVARLAPVKNHGVLLEACAALRARGVEFRCLLVGDGRARGDVAAKRSRLGLESEVDLIGVATQRAVLSLWQRATVGTLASDSEGMPVSLMEAAACGVPAVGTAVGGVPELIDDGFTGLLVAPGDADALAAALELILSDHALAARLGAAARHRAETRFSLAGQMDRLLSLWEEVLA
ncbi:MAG TPA: glycosyltransferase family 4 protein [Candidatus Limnocylindria bacterium]